MVASKEIIEVLRSARRLCKQSKKEDEGKTPQPGESTQTQLLQQACKSLELAAQKSLMQEALGDEQG